MIYSQNVYLSLRLHSAGEVLPFPGMYSRVSLNIQFYLTQASHLIVQHHSARTEEPTGKALLPDCLVVLFLGRVRHCKGRFPQKLTRSVVPDYFLDTSKTTAPCTVEKKFLVSGQDKET